MKKTIFISLLLVFIAPQIASAVWWNPSTWKIFQQQVKPAIIVPQEEQVNGIFFTKNTARVRGCESTSCEILGTYPINSEFNLSYKDINDLPEWIKISWINDGITNFGYINKISFSKSKTILSPQSDSIPVQPINSQPTGTVKKVINNPSVTPNQVQDLKEIIEVIDKVYLDLTFKLSEMAEIMDTMDSDYQKLSKYLDANQKIIYQKAILNRFSKFDLIGEQIKSYLNNLSKEREQMLATQKIDKQYWLDNGIQEMVNYQETVSSAILKVISEYKDFRDVVLKGLSEYGNSLPQSSQYEPSSTQNSECNNVEQKVRDDIASGGGFATESQIQSLVYQKMKQLGCY